MSKPSTDDATLDSPFDAAKSLSPPGRAALLCCVRATAIQLPPWGARPYPGSPTSWSC